MNDLNIPATQSTPSIITDSANGTVILRGDSYPENSFELFGPVVQWVDGFLAEGERALAMQLELQYLNTSSVKAVMDIFDLLEAAHANGRAVSVTWFYDSRNERVGELAEEFKEDCSFPFSVVGR
jgi:hypothetical protein